MKDFIKYVLDFYGESGLFDMKATRDEVWNATCIRLIRFKDIPFEGDSLDREKVRDIILESRQQDVIGK
jgi:hypothetical protein